MNESSPWTLSREAEFYGVARSRRSTFMRFLIRYPIFLLAFGPPQFKSTVSSVDTGQAHFDYWNLLQGVWLAAIAARAVIRLVYAPSVRIPKQVQSVLKYSFFLGLLFIGSIVYSPGRIVSAEFCILYFLIFLCVIEFLVHAYWDPPDWMQCIFELRLILTLLLIPVVLCLLIRPAFVMNVVSGAGIRILGGSVAPIGTICPVIAIISAYNFLHSLEPKARSVLFFVVGTAGLAATQARGAEIAFLIILFMIGLRWAKMRARSAYIFASSIGAFVLIASVFITAVGGERIWNTFNRGQDTSGILTASGRTLYWADLIQYCIDHPQGMGYIAGIRHAHFGQYAMLLHADLTNVGGTDNSYMQVLSDAGWLSLLLYLIMLFKTLSLGWRLEKKALMTHLPLAKSTSYGLRCAMIVLMFCLLEAMEGSDFVIPLRQEFYLQTILIAIILGACTSILLATRPRSA